MDYAHVVPDIPARALDGYFDYAIPDELSDTCQVGATVLVNFGHRDVVGYIVARAERPSEGVNPKRVLPILHVLAPPAFDEVGSDLAAWMAHEYAAPCAVCLRLMLPPGQTMKVTRHDGGSWQLVVERTQAVDDRWVTLTLQAQEFTPRKNAVRQAHVLEALAAGPQRMAELSVLVPGASGVVKVLEKHGAVSVQHHRKIRGNDTTTLSSAAAPRPAYLTAGQQDALAAIAHASDAGAGDVVLVDGVTGSGKTEVYLNAIERVRAQGRGAIVLVPEISLTAQTVGRFRSRFGDDVAILHSHLSTGERFDQWDMVRSGRAHVVVGARSALFAPLSSVGLIIIDEEHENSYKQDQSPRYHARDVAARLAQLRHAALVLGSATPSLESLERCRQGSWRHATWVRKEMPERPGQAVLPQVRLIDMRHEFAAKNGSIFSQPLREALLQVAHRREKAVLLLNRRGFASFLMCRECGCVPTCTHCSTALTYHERTHSLVCHSCGRSWPVRAYPDPSTKCPNCGSRYLAQFGVGTQRVEDELAMLFEQDTASGTNPVEIIRMDADTTKTKGSHTRLLEQFDAAECAVLVGTQMIAKGLDFPEVTLVGVVNADTTLKLPDFRAAEKTYQLLEQVAGRAGRGLQAGSVLIQTYWATHPALEAVAHHDRAQFERYELEQREEAYYPPFSRLANIVVSGVQEPVVRERTDLLCHALRDAAADEEDWEILGPADCVKARIKDRFRRHVMIKAAPDAEVSDLIERCVAMLPHDRRVSIAIDVDAYDIM